MNPKRTRRVLWIVAIGLIGLSLAVGGITQYRAVKELQHGIGKYAYGKPSGWGVREFKPPEVYVGKVIDLKIYALPMEEMDLPGWQSRYKIRRETADGEVYEAYYATDLVDVKDTPPDKPVTGGFPPLKYLDIVHRDQ